MSYLYPENPRMTTKQKRELVRKALLLIGQEAGRGIGFSYKDSDGTYFGPHDVGNELTELTGQETWGDAIEAFIGEIR